MGKAADQKLGHYLPSCTATLIEQKDDRLVITWPEGIVPVCLVKDSHIVLSCCNESAVILSEPGLDCSHTPSPAPSLPSPHFRILPCSHPAVSTSQTVSLLTGQDNCIFLV